MALTGLAWVGFLVGHLSGNLLMFKSKDAFNAYASGLHQLGPVLWLVEAGLVAILAIHVGAALRSIMRNKGARPRGYELSRTNGKATLFSRTMAIGGVVMLVFIVTHVFWFRVLGDPAAMYERVVTSFKNPLIAGWYVLAMVFVGLHVAHGFGSAFQTLGAFKPEWRDRLRKAGVALGALVSLGFMSFPIWAFLMAEV